MKKEGRIALKEAEGMVGQFPYVLAYRSSGILLQTTAELDEKTRTDLFNEAAYVTDGNLEARFFSESGELHVFASGNGVCAVVTDFAGKHYLDERYEIAAKFREKIGTRTKLVVRRILDQDDDGQMIVRHTCLAGLEA